MSIQQERYNDNDPRTARTQSALGACLTSLGRYADAEQALLAAHATLESRLGPRHRKTELVRQRLVDLYTAWGKPGQAAAWATRPAFEAER